MCIVCLASPLLDWNTRVGVFCRTLLWPVVSSLRCVHPPSLLMEGTLNYRPNLVPCRVSVLSRVRSTVGSPTCVRLSALQLMDQDTHHTPHVMSRSGRSPDP